MRYLLLVSAMLFATPSLAADLTIEMLNKDENGNKMVYSQEVVRVDVGDTINWVPTTKGHNVEMMASPNDMKFKSKVSKVASMTFDTPGIYYYLFTPYKGMGMIGLVVVGGDVSNKDEVSKARAFGKSKKKLKALLRTV